MRTPISLFPLIILLAATPASAADWQRLSIHGNTIAAASESAVRISLNRGRTFVSHGIHGAQAIATTAKEVFVASPAGITRIADGRQTRIALPPAALTVRGLRAGADWLMAIAEVEAPGLTFTRGDKYFRVGVFLRRNGRWRRLFKDIPSSSGKALTTLRIGPRGHAIASLIFTAGCGGVSVAGGQIWRPDRAARLLPAQHSLWDMPSGIHRDWLLSGCPEDCGAACVNTTMCLYDPSRAAQPVPPTDHLPSTLHISPDSHWVAMTVDTRVHVYARSAAGLVEEHQVVGQVIAARNDGITLRTADDTIVHAGAQLTDLGPLPAETQAVDVDRQGESYALTADAMLTHTPRGWAPMRGF